jgi:hypothetical protein
MLRAFDIASLRRWTLTRLRTGDEHPLVQPHDLGPVVARLAADSTPAQIRVTLAWLVVRDRDALDVSAQDIHLWIEHSGLRGVARSARALAAEQSLSTRHVHRRISGVDAKLAILLNADDQAWPRAQRAGTAGAAPSSPAEASAALRAEAFATAHPLRALDAIAKYTGTSCSRSMSHPKYLQQAKDQRYRDARTVRGWSATLVRNPPIAAVSPTDFRALSVCRGVDLSTDPYRALASVNHAIATQQRDALPVLLAHAGRLIPDAAAAGVDVWLSYLQLRYHAAMESEHISALRWARAWQLESTRLAGLGDHRVRRGLAGRGHTLQMFGHYRAAADCYRGVVEHAAHFGVSDAEGREALHDAYGQIAYCYVLSGNEIAVAEVALKRTERLADDIGECNEVQFTRSRRNLEVAFGQSVSRRSLSLAGASRSRRSHLDNSLARFLDAAAALPKTNRRLAAWDLLLLYAICTRDVGLAAQARDAFQSTTETTGGFANLADRFNARLGSAASLNSRFADLELVTVRPDALRDRIAIPRNRPGLLVSQVIHRAARSLGT